MHSLEPLIKAKVIRCSIVAFENVTIVFVQG